MVKKKVQTEIKSKEEQKVDFAAIEKKWQKEWESKKIFQVNEDSKKKKYYVSEMYPYPSASFLHVGHVRNYTIGDVFARFKRMSGFNVLYPMGYDSFGLPAEAAAKKEGTHPRIYAEKAIAKISEYFKALGNSYDWSRTLASHEPEYYKWNQYFFLKLLEKGLAYRKKAPVNWCEKCQSVLANEEAEGGKCWRCGEEVIQKEMEQWFFKITDYAERLLNDLDKIDWHEKIKTMQRNWIGKSYGTEVEFEISNFGDISNKEFVFLHAFGDRIDNAFWNWLKNEIEVHGGKVVFNKDLPNTNSPKVEEQMAFVQKNYKFNENTIVIGHSLGNILLMKLLEKIKVKIAGAVMVGAPLPASKKDIIDGKAFKDLKSRPVLAEYCDWKFNFNEVKSKIDKIIILEDKKDHIVPFGQPKKLSDLLGAEYILSEANATHFNGKQEEQVLNCIFKKWPVFTTRPDTLYGVTFMVVAAEHPRLMEITTKENKKQVEEFVKRCQKARTPEEVESLDKDGVFTGSYAINPLTKEKVPVWAGNFVVAEYGSGMVMAVPTHDSRDFEFAQKYKIPMKIVIIPKRIDKKNPPVSGKQMVIRKTIHGIVFDKKTNKYLCLKWKKHPWTTFITGGVDDGEDVVEAAKREILEETGYKNIKFEKTLGGEVYAEYFAAHKDENRGSYTTAVLFSLVNDERKKISVEEIEKHEAIWKPINEINEASFNCAELDLWLSRLKGEEGAYVGNGVLINSDKFNGLDNKKAIEEITKYLESKKLGKKTVNYKIRDWMISRQRYWGTPIPVIYCDKCGVVPVAEKELPVLLPEKVDFKVNGNPLATNSDFINTKCPKCGGKGKRETDTMGGFVDSSWYFLRYCDSKNKNKPFDEKKVNYWMPIDQYIGGAEHAVMHLMYARFFIKALKDMGFVKFDEPFKKLFNQGVVYKDGAKMSKSKGNAVFQTDISDKYGIDTARLFLMFVSSPDKQMEWSDDGVEGSFRIINRLIRLKEKVSKETTPIQEHKINKAVKSVTGSIESFDYPKAIISIVECIDSFNENIKKENYETLLKLIHPFVPHITEQLWHDLGNKTFLSLEAWPVVDEKKLDDKLEQTEKNVDKAVSDILNVLGIIKEKTGKEGNKIYLYVMPFEIASYNAESIGKRISKEVKVFAVNDKAKYDPEQKSSKAKPGKPGIYIE